MDFVLCVLKKGYTEQNVLIVGNSKTAFFQPILIRFFIFPWERGKTFCVEVIWYLQTFYLFYKLV